MTSMYQSRATRFAGHALRPGDFVNKFTFSRSF
jgi:hypothetical protein